MLALTEAGWKTLCMLAQLVGRQTIWWQGKRNRSTGPFSIVNSIGTEMI